jgi:hypothetical protein
MELRMETKSHKVTLFNSISENIDLKVKMLSTNPQGRRPFDVRNQFPKISVTGLMMSTAKLNNETKGKRSNSEGEI